MVDRELQEGCAAAARAGAQVLREKWGTARTIDKKGAIDLVTDADRAAEAAVLAVLAERFPGADVLAEESGLSGGQGLAPPAGRLRFIVDPLDGTTNYASGIPHFAVNVAVADGPGDAGVAAAATCDPLRGELFLATRGGGATLDGSPIRPTACAALGDAVLATGFPYDVHQSHQEILAVLGAFLSRARGIRRFGAAALDLAWVACGRLDGFWEATLKPWDVAAGILLGHEAGALVTDLSGTPRVLEAGAVLIAPPALHPLLLQVLADARR
jgi:myo-inositol-1(or 4)-monophosphatase